MFGCSRRSFLVKRLKSGTLSVCGQQWSMGEVPWTFGATSLQIQSSICINGVLNAKKCRQILTLCNSGPKCILQQDIDPKYTAKSWLQCKVGLCMTPTEPWSQHHEGVSGITEGCEQVYIHGRSVVGSPRYLEKPSTRVLKKKNPRRTDAVLKATGGPFLYWFRFLLFSFTAFCKLIKKIMVNTSLFKHILCIQPFSHLHKTV